MIVRYIDIVHFILLNRRKKAFEGWTFDQILVELKEKTKQRLVAISLDKNGRIDGVCIAQDIPEYKALMINNVLTTSPVAIKALLKKYHEWWEGYEIRGMRNGRLRIYKNTKNLVSKLEH